MAIGDDAAAAGMALVAGTSPANTLDTEDNLTRDYIAQGMGATIAATPNKVIKRDLQGRAKVYTPAAADDIATKGYVDGKVTGQSDKIVNGPHEAAITSAGYFAVRPNGTTRFAVNDQGDLYNVHDVNASGDITSQGDQAAAGRMTASTDIVAGRHLYTNGATVVTSSYVAAYINGDGRVGKSASSRRYKRAIRNAPAELFAGILGLRPRVFKWRKALDPSNDDQVGLIAEEVAELAPWLVVRDPAGNPETVRYEMLGLALLPVVKALSARVEALEAELRGQ